MKYKRFSRRDSSEISELVSLTEDPHQLLGRVIGERFIEYRKKWEEAVRFNLKLSYPLHIDFEIFFKCNLKCIMCVMGLPGKERVKYGDPKARLKFKTFQKVIDEGVPFGLRSIGFNGINEPLLEGDLIQWIRYARENGIVDAMFSTNGLLMDAAVSRTLIASGLTRIMISIDAATPETYARVRGVDAFDKVVDQVRQFVAIRKEMKRRLPLVRVSFIKMKHNIHELELFIDMWKDTVDFFSIQSYANPLIPGEPYFEDLEQYHIHPERTDIHFRCPQPWVRLMIRHNGDLNPCCGIQGPNLIIGNIYQDTIHEVWNSQQMDTLRELHRAGDYHKNRYCNLCVKSLHFK